MEVFFLTQRTCSTLKYKNLNKKIFFFWQNVDFYRSSEIQNVSESQNRIYPPAYSIQNHFTFFRKKFRVCSIRKKKKLLAKGKGKSKCNIGVIWILKRRNIPADLINVLRNVHWYFCYQNNVNETHIIFAQK